MSMARSFFLLAVLAPFTLTGCGGGSSNSGAAGAAGGVVPVTITRSTTPLSPSALAGTWNGTWQNLTFGSTGGVTFTIGVSQANAALTLTEAFTGEVFGAPASPAATITGPITTAGVSLTGPLTGFGTVNITIDPDGNIAGTALNPNANVSQVTINGVATATSIQMQYVVTFTPAHGGGTANGQILLSKSSE